MTSLESQLILASASPARLQTLTQAGFHPQVIVSHVDEDAVAATIPPGNHLAMVSALAEAKARAVAAELSPTRPTYVLGCDSMAQVGDRLLGKPHTPEVARERVRELSGARVVLHTAHSLIKLPADASEASTPRLGSPAAPLTRVASTTIFFTEFTKAEIDAYVATGEPLEVAGSFTLDGLGGSFIAGIAGDPSNVIGVSLPLLREMLTELGAFLPDFWSRN